MNDGSDPKNDGKITLVPNVPMVRCPADITIFPLVNHYSYTDLTSYPFNALAFMEGNRFPESFQDGTSNTIGYAERFADIPKSRFDMTLGATISKPALVRPSSFADIRYDDAMPVHDARTKQCLGSTTGIQFLARPNPLTVVPGNLISCHGPAISVGFLDGSVRKISQNVSGSVFWAHMTPASGD
jgi:hypothetical protein